MAPCNAVIPFTKDELADLIWIRLGKTPVSVRCQALLVIAEFGDGTTSVHNIDELTRSLPSPAVDLDAVLDEALGWS